MTITKKESEWAKRIKMWLSVIGISGVSLLTGTGVGIRMVEAKAVRPYIQKVVRAEYDTLHAPAAKRVCEVEKKVDDIGYEVKLVRNILEMSVDKPVFDAAKDKTDGTYWRRPQKRF